jgi:hypothetical protein
MRHQNPDDLPNPTKNPRDSFDLDALLHPARAFAHPMDVVRDDDLTLNEKRAILASWASDACAVEAAPELRLGAGGAVVRWDEIMDALRLLDRRDAATAPRRSHARWQWRRWRGGPRGEGGEADHGSQLI